MQQNDEGNGPGRIRLGALIDAVCVGLGVGVPDGEGVQVTDSVRMAVPVHVGDAVGVGDGDSLGDVVGPGACGCAPSTARARFAMRTFSPQA